MYKFQDIELKFNRRLRDSLSDIYGIGFQKSSYICDSLGLGLSFNINKLNIYFFELIVYILKFFYILEERLKGLIYQRVTYFFENRLIKGLRLSKGLPVRGQRTQSNSQTSRKLTFLLFKKEDDVSLFIKKDKIKKDKIKKDKIKKVKVKKGGKK